MEEELSKRQEDVPPSKGTVDLSSLQGLDFAPDWGSEKPKNFSGSEKPKTKRRADSGKKGRPPKSRRKFTKTTLPPDPDHSVSFYPESVPFGKLVREMKTSCRTYSLFDLAKLILQKPERFLVQVTPLNKAPEEPCTYFVTKPDGLPFLTEKEAANHLVENFGETFFELEERDSEGPNGSFSVINKCGITGELLAPPNYHRYGEMIREHHATRLPEVSFEQFQRKIETENNTEAVDAWVNGMKKTHVYRLKNRSGEEPEFLETREALLRFLKGHRFGKLINKSSKARFSAAHISKLPQGPLRRDVEVALSEQIRYPLMTSNALRASFRRMKFTIYKQRSKGITLVCAVQRKPRVADAVFAASIQALLDFIDGNPTVRKSELVNGLLGFADEERTEEQEEQVRQLARDLRWLVTEGYLAEFGDGTFLLPAVRSASNTIGEDGFGQANRDSPKGRNAKVEAEPERE